MKESSRGSSVRFWISLAISSMLVLVTSFLAIYGFYKYDWDFSVFIVFFFVESLILGIFTIIKSYKFIKYQKNQTEENEEDLRSSFIAYNFWLVLFSLAQAGILFVVLIHFKVNLLDVILRALPLIIVSSIINFSMFIFDLFNEKDYKNVRLIMIQAPGYFRLFVIQATLIFSIFLENPYLIFITIKIYLDLFVNFGEQVRIRNNKAWNDLTIKERKFRLYSGFILMLGFGIIILYFFVKVFSTMNA